MADFETLRSGRRRLHDFCSFHSESLKFFASGRSYKLHQSEGELPVGLRHMTSTATCLESLRECPNQDLEDHIRWFVDEALARPHDRWTSDGAAGIYCRCRALPLVIEHSAEFGRIRPHLVRILAQLKKGDRFGIGEADPIKDSEDWYPPNAYHTFWALEALKQSDRFGRSFRAFKRTQDLGARWNAMLLWAWEVLGCQIALHKSKSSGLDTDQLLWALTIVTRFRAPGIFSPSTMRYRDIVKQAIETFFDAQDQNTGTWVHHEPLFHYPTTGNAYCYIFESLNPLLKNALNPDEDVLRALLRPHAEKLFALLDYAEVTKTTLVPNRAFGWSSGHRTNMTLAESWATAAVFGCMQALRRLVGVWTRSDAIRELSHRPPTGKPSEAITKLAERGNTWSEAETVGQQLITMFVNPLWMRSTNESTDPDDLPIAETQARSAILFGPPGTSKTTLAQKVASALEWDFVELHPSHFVAAGLPNVQRTADEIFTKLMELDRCVVLFDEVDELMREREMEPDAFGRFLTTSMLPKLAELWKHRKIVYFVATNHIGHFDQALTRSQRFDALILVPPPAFSVKIKRLIEILRELAPHRPVSIRLKAAKVSAALAAVQSYELKVNKLIDRDQVLAKFILLRWDQLEELAHILLRQASGASAKRMTIDASRLSNALMEMSDSRLREPTPYSALKRDRGLEGRDFGKDVVWLVRGRPRKTKALIPLLREANELTWCVGTKEMITEVAPGRSHFTLRGEVRFRPSSRIKHKKAGRR